MEQSPRILAPRINDSLWENHRDAVERLYIAENRKLLGQDGVMEVMAREYSFFASKAQYEARFKRWNLRKKIRVNDEWNAILPRIDIRANDGRETQVVFNGIVLCEERVARELARRRSSKSLRMTNTQDPETPPGFTIQSPSSSIMDEHCSISNADNDDNAEIITYPISDNNADDDHEIEEEEEEEERSVPSTPLRYSEAKTTSSSDTSVYYGTHGKLMQIGFELRPPHDVWICRYCVAVNLIVLACEKCPVCGSSRQEWGLDHSGEWKYSSRSSFW